MPDFTQPKTTENEPVIKPEATDHDILVLIERHLKSIRGMLAFFTIVLIIYIIIQILF